MTDSRKPVIGSVYTNPDDVTQRPIRSFVLRQGHLSDAQTRAIEALMPQWGIEYRPEILNLAQAFGREAFLAGRMPKKPYAASASSPTTGKIAATSAKAAK